MAKQPPQQQHTHNPFRGFLDVMSEMNRMQHHWMLKDKPDMAGDRTHATAWVPHADIFAVDGDLVIRCELPGMGPNDVDVTVSSGVLTISGERTNDLDETKVELLYPRAGLRRVPTKHDSSRRHRPKRHRGLGAERVAGGHREGRRGFAITPHRGRECRRSGGVGLIGFSCSKRCQGRAVMRGPLCLCKGVTAQ